MDFENPYQTPNNQEPFAADIKVEHPFLIMPKNTSLPECCLKCGEPATERFTQKLFWVSPWVYLCILINILVLLVVYLITRKVTTVSYSLCDQHAREKRMRSTTIVVLWLVIMLFLIASAALESFIPIWMAAATLVTIIIYSLVKTQPLTVKKFVDDRFWIKGAGEEMLARFPNNKNDSQQAISDSPPA